MLKLFRKKALEAKTVIERCEGRRGFFASKDKYRYQYWTRDLAFSFDALMNLGYKNKVKEQLQLIFSKQKRDGEVPSAINPASFVRYQTYHSWTVDSNILAVIMLLQFMEKTGDEIVELGKVEKLIQFIQGHQDKKTGLVRGADWRDDLHIYKNKFLFSNQVLLKRMYQIIGSSKQERQIEKSIENIFWNEKLRYYQDFPESNHFDSFGHSLGILYDIIPKKRFGSMLDMFTVSSSLFGLRNVHPVYKNVNQREFTYQNSSIWPFVHSNFVLTLKKMGEKELAEKQFLILTMLNGFNEWYYPFGGLPKGSKHQLWSAATYLQASKELQMI